MPESPELSINNAGDLLALQKQVREDAAIGAIYDTCVHNCIAHGGHTGKAMVGRETIVAHWLAELHGFSDQHLQDTAAFGTAPGVSADGQAVLMSRGEVQACNSGTSVFGPATGQQVQYRTMSACSVANGRILEEWLVVDSSHIASQLGADPEQLGRSLAEINTTPFQPNWDQGEVASSQGQTGPMHSELDNPLLASWTDALNFRRFDHLAGLYHDTASIYAPGGRQLSGGKALAQFWLSLLAALPDGQLQVQEVTVDSSATQIGMLWRLCGRHTGPGLTPRPSAARLSVQGISQLQLQDGKIGAEWCLFDEIDLLTQIHRSASKANNTFQPLAPIAPETD